MHAAATVMGMVHSVTGFNMFTYAQHLALNKVKTWILDFMVKKQHLSAITKKLSQLALGNRGPH